MLNAKLPNFDHRTFMIAAFNENFSLRSLFSHQNRAIVALENLSNEREASLFLKMFQKIAFYLSKLHCLRAKSIK